MVDYVPTVRRQLLFLGSYANDSSYFLDPIYTQTHTKRKRTEYDIKKVFRSHETARERWRRCSTYAGLVSGAVLSPQNTPKAAKKTPEYGCHGCPSDYAPRWI